MQSLLTEKELDIFNIIKYELKEIFDVGVETSIDYYKLHPTANYHLFEPIVLSFNQLVESVGNVPNIKLNNVACYDTNGIGMFHGEAACFNARPIDKFGSRPVEEPYPVKMIRLDDYIDENNITNLDFLKIDVEGGELNVLKGLGKYIDKFKYIQVEYNYTYLVNMIENRNVMLKDIFEILNNYIAVKIEDGRTYETYSESMENYVCCNYMFTNKEYKKI